MPLNEDNEAIGLLSMSSPCIWSENLAFFGGCPQFVLHDLSKAIRNCRLDIIVIEQHHIQRGASF